MSDPYNDPKLLTEIAKHLPIRELYIDVGKKSAVEVGKALADLAKTFRLFLAPFQLTAAVQDRFERWLTDVRSRVPLERQIEAAPEIVGPTLDRLRHMQDGNLLTTMFLQLLSCAIDRDKVDLAHPAFPELIGQMSSDEARILNELSLSTYNFEMRQEILHSRGLILPGKIVDNKFPVSVLAFPAHFMTYVEHLKTLGLVHYGASAQVWNERDPGTNKPISVRSPLVLDLTDFGRLFAMACIPASDPFK